MPRPTDNYSHAQFETVESDFQGETVRCIHCKQWTGSLRTLHRKKEHLMRCSAYASWRAAGNGQELPPPNRYTSKRDSSALGEADNYNSSPYGDYGTQQPQQQQQQQQQWQYTPNMSRNKTIDITRFYDEFWEDEHNQKCMRTRCKHCGYSRAKNSTRQYEHLQQCHEFLKSTEGQQAVEEGLLTAAPVDSTTGHVPAKSIWRGGAPNPNLSGGQKQRQNRVSNAVPARAQPPSPSLANHLLTMNKDAVDQAVQIQFLSHAGCGTLQASALEQWLVQQTHLSRASTSFIGNLIGKIRLPATDFPQSDTSHRALDLLVSTINNVKRELEFLRTTQHKYNIAGGKDMPTPPTKGYLDLMQNASGPSSSLLEGMVVLWATEHLKNLSWQYAAGFIQPGAPTSTSYSLPSYLQGGYGMQGNYQRPGMSGSDAEHKTHIAALQESLIPNWTSSGFMKFVEACKAIVDELANSQTTGSGAVELINCEVNFRQVVWLWKQIWPEVTGMGEEEDDTVEPSAANGQGENGDEPMAIEDEDDDGMPAESPYGGTGLEAVAAANRAD